MKNEEKIKMNVNLANEIQQCRTNLIIVKVTSFMNRQKLDIKILTIGVKKKKKKIDLHWLLPHVRIISFFFEFLHVEMVGTLSVWHKIETEHGRLCYFVT